MRTENDGGFVPYDEFVTYHTKQCWCCLCKAIKTIIPDDCERETLAETVAEVLARNSTATVDPHFGSNE